LFGRVDAQLHCLPPLHLPDVHDVFVDRHPAGLSTTALPDRYHDLVVSVSEPSRVVANAFEDLLIALPEAQESGLADVDLGAWTARAVITPDRRIYRLQHR
jgi:hypothetical protein